MNRCPTRMPWPPSSPAVDARRSLSLPDQPDRLATRRRLGFWASVPLALLALAPGLALADILPRSFPADAQRGVMEVVAPPEVRLNGQAARLAPGVRIYARNQLIVMSSTLVGQPQVVNYRRDGTGLVRDVWLLTDAEAALKLPNQAPTTNIVFSSQVPTQAVDDGKTPYAQLPKYNPTLK